MTTARFNLDDAKRIAAAMRKTEAQAGNITHPDPTNARPAAARVEGVLVTAITASTASGTVPTTAIMRVWRGPGKDWQAADIVRLTNRDDGLSAAIGARVMAVEINGELRPISASGGGSDLVLFTLVTVNCAAGTATGTALLTGCTATLPTGTQDITDDLGCFLTGAEALLVGMKCWCQYSLTAYGCTYSIVSMCCADATC